MFGRAGGIEDQALPTHLVAEPRFLPLGVLAGCRCDRRGEFLAVEPTLKHIDGFAHADAVHSRTGERCTVGECRSHLLDQAAPDHLCCTGIDSLMQYRTRPE